jgi:hypothetical protein
MDERFEDAIQVQLDRDPDIQPGDEIDVYVDARTGEIHTRYVVSAADVAARKLRRSASSLGAFPRVLVSIAIFALWALFLAGCAGNEFSRLTH